VSGTRDRVKAPVVDDDAGTLARLGGDEFVVLLPGLRREGVVPTPTDNGCTALVRRAS